MVMDLKKITVKRVQNELPPLVEAPPLPVVVEPRHSTHQSIETLVVVLAVITILGVIAGIIARLCGGRHFGGSGEHDIEGWVERKCRSCIDAGVPSEPPPAEPKPTTTTAAVAAAAEAKPPAEEASQADGYACWVVGHQLSPTCLLFCLGERTSLSVSESVSHQAELQEKIRYRPHR